jgi:hypothetical protein
MTEEEMRRQVEEANRKTAEAEAARKKAADDLAEFKRKQDDAAENARKDRVKHRREAITKLFNDAVEAKRIDPKAREQFAKLTGYETDDAAAERITDEQVKEHIDSVGKPAGKSGDKTQHARTGGTAGTGDEPDYSQMTPDQELNDKAVRFCRSTNQDPTKYGVLLAATQHVLRTDSDLAERYKYMPSDRFARSVAR